MSSPFLPPSASPSSIPSSASISPLSVDSPAESATGSGQDETPTGSPTPGGRRRRRTLLGVLAALVVGAASTAVYVAVDDQPPPPRPDIPLDTWVPYWTLDDALPTVEQRGPSMREISPFFYTATADAILLDPNASPEATQRFLEAARRTGADIVPSIVDHLPAGAMAALLADPVTRARHVEAIRVFAADGDFDGIDIDYEQFAFADGRDTWATTRPNWVAFIEELGAVLRAEGRTLTVSIPPVYDSGQTDASGFWVYDYGAIVDHVDRIRIMTYDFSVQDPGPIAPLDWVETSITGAIEATGSPEKLVLGLPVYGRNWVVATVGTCPADAPGRTAVTARSVDDLVARRGATPLRVDETGEWTFEYELEVADETTSCVQTRRVHYVDGDGIRERMDLARRYRLDGASLWALGFDDDDVWQAILPTVADPTATTTPS